MGDPFFLENVFSSKHPRGGAYVNDTKDFWGSHVKFFRKKDL